MKPAEQYIVSQVEPFRSMLLHLQVTIQTTIPNAVLLYKWKLPFYYIGGKLPFCYLNCARGYVDLVFWHGTHLVKHPNHLVLGGRKHLKSLRYKTLEDINQKILVDLLKEAYSVKDKNYYK
ncbi:uncharacterized protein DUF1801 [Ulvibacter sp. MAR_2010_11]|uniref:DUF1801 domain-containing protein n=1 Tax=Ulvibacter sp. MAR_2010_11 TaxID=1250229 RepID=UPI000C2BEF5F|nr:DUF1801 domain-containing protein [Ulvibacter sp. MAR_2010_11]PKA83609.1 uncharacterized protein DUF1801 [Ulvibacter sp. MAR_2010_11]